MKYVLASQSPRRIELMKWINPHFSVQKAQVDEHSITQAILKQASTPYTKETLEHLVQTLAQAKAESITSQEEADSLIIGADTLVHSKELGILGKPKDPSEARYMLKELSRTGKHFVYTGIALRYRGKTSCFSTRAEVSFQPLDALQEDLIDAYVESGSPLDKAGAYSIGDQGSLLIQSIQGDFYTILGFPITSIIRAIRNLQ